MRSNVFISHLLSPVELGGQAAGHARSRAAGSGRLARRARISRSCAAENLIDSPARLGRRSERPSRAQVSPRWPPPS